MVEEMIEGKLAHLKETKESPILTSEELEPAFTVKARDIEQTHICMAARTVKLSDPDYYAHRVLSCIMGGGMSSRLFQHVREQKGLAYSVYSSCNPFSEDGYYNIYAGVSHDRIAEAIEAIRGELLLLGEKGVSDEEIAKAKTQIKSSYIFGQESVNGRMVGIGQTCILLGKVRTQDEVLASIDAVDQQAVARAIAKIADPGRYSAVAVTNKEFDLGAMVQGK
jgi:predicted Zn-dependent peptidase